MTTMTQSSIFPVSVDIHEVFSRIGSDMVMFLIAMLAYWILHSMRLRASSRKAKAVDKEVSVISDQKSPCESTDGTLKAKQSPTPAPAVSPIPVQVRAVQPQQATRKSLAADKQPFSVDDTIALMRNYAAARNIKETLRAFRLIQKNGVCVTGEMYNIVLYAWIRCGNIWAAENLMDEVKEAGVADEASFVILIKALIMVQDFEKAQSVLHSMEAEVGVSPGVATFNEMLVGFARRSSLSEGVSLLQVMKQKGIQPTSFTLAGVAKLVNGARRINQRSSVLQQIFEGYDFVTQHCSAQDYPTHLPCLVSTIRRAATSSSPAYLHEVEIKGTAAAIDVVKATLSHHCFVDNPGNSTWTMESHVDKQQDEAFCARFAAILKCVSKQGLRMPLGLDDVLLQFLGSDLFCLRVHFESYTPRAEILDDLSRRYPRLGFRHCWAKPSSDICGQQTLVNGEETDEACFCRHIGAVQIG